MHIIKLNAIDSTNSYLRQLSNTNALEDYTTVVTNYQTNGRGQMGTQWSSQEAKNLMVSVYKDVSFVNIESHFFISIVVSLSILEALQRLHIPKLSIKWPNDILSENKKIGGILIENVIKHNHLQNSIIGFGLNINQTLFDDLPNASSLRLITGKVFNLDEVLLEILDRLRFNFKKLKQHNLKALKMSYEHYLFRKNKPSTFQDVEGVMFSGFIIGVTKSGNLQIEMEDRIIKEFNLKEVSLLY